MMISKNVQISELNWERIAVRDGKNNIIIGDIDFQMQVLRKKSIFSIDQTIEQGQRKK